MESYVEVCAFGDTGVRIFFDPDGVILPDQPPTKVIRDAILQLHPLVVVADGVPMVWEEGA